MQDSPEARELEIRGRGADGPFVVWCHKCDKHVDLFEVETPIQDVPDERLPGLMKKVNTGEIIVTVECHGERWRMSNRWGRLA